MKNMISYVKNEGVNLNVLTIILKLIVNWSSGCDWKFVGHMFFGHAFFKACQHSTFDEKMCKGLTYVSIKSILTYLQKCII
jgi:hypothetical protein